MGSLSQKADVTKEDVGLDQVPNIDATKFANWDSSGAVPGQSPVWNGSSWEPGKVALENEPITNSVVQNITPQDEITINLNNGHNIRIELDSTSISTLNITNIPQVCLINFQIDKVGSATITWPSNVNWNNNTVPSLSGINLIRLFTLDGGTSWKGFASIIASN